LKLELCVPCLFGLEGLVGDEVRRLGLADVKVENGRVYTIEGNSGDACQQNSYPIGYFEIYGYGTPKY